MTLDLLEPVLTTMMAALLATKTINDDSFRTDVSFHACFSSGFWQKPVRE